jgi:hypothetical protein
VSPEAFRRAISLPLCTLAVLRRSLLKSLGGRLPIHVSRWPRLFARDGSDDWRVRLELEGLVVVRGDRRERVDGWIERAGGHVVAVASVVPSLGLTVHSAYLAGLDGRTAGSHLWAAPGTPGVFAQRVLESLPGITIARGCLLDHAAELHSAVAAATGEPAGIEIDDQALDRAARLWEADDG